MSSGFPTDQYTPHGFLANPYAVARSWTEGYGGNLRSIHDGVGFGWHYPWARGAHAGAHLQIGLTVGQRVLFARPDFDSAGLVSPYHSSALFEYAWDMVGTSYRARFVLVGEHELGLELSAVSTGNSSPADQPAVSVYSTMLHVVAVGWQTGGSLSSASADSSAKPSLGSVGVGAWGIHTLSVDADGLPVVALRTTSNLDGLFTQQRPDWQSEGPTVAIGVAIALPIDLSKKVKVVASLRREPGSSNNISPRFSVATAMKRARTEDDAFWHGAARLEGDWPASWRRGWVYDLETTRMCVFPPGGIFTDAWPSWMIQWPRVVLAEGSLDALRLSYGSPHLAKRVAESMLRDAPAANVPCSFQHGEPNMVAKDGSLCGTSPAWCVPFYNLERLYLRTLDRGWLARIYEPLARYFEWWLRERADRSGWAVYKCTWEAGEDDTPRLDPDREGDNVVSEFVRPVELQATMSLSAHVLARFAGELGRTREAAGWRQVARSFAARTRGFWDEQAGRFRDWDTRSDSFLEPRGEENYWGIDPCRYSVLALTPLLAGLATPAQSRVLIPELEAYARPPWILWPSWSYILLESALVAGQRAFASRVASEIVGRVYNQLDRRQIGDPRGPTPGVAREYWPLDLSTWDACEGYGWGATTASLLVRQIFGFLESAATDGVRFTIAPGLPPAMIESGARYAIRNMPYRGAFIDVQYTVPDDSRAVQAPHAPLDVNITAERASRCDVVDDRGMVCLQTEHFSDSHRFRSELGRAYDVRLQLS